MPASFTKPLGTKETYNVAPKTLNSPLIVDEDEGGFCVGDLTVGDGGKMQIDGDFVILDPADFTA